MAPGTRKLALTAHVVSSVGWLGAVGSFLALAVVGLTSRDDQLTRAVYVAVEPTTWFVIVPLSLASLLTGLLQALGTAWGLFRHYWVIAKLLLTVLATVVLLVHTQPIGHMADLASGTTLAGSDGVRVQLVVDAVAALLVLLAATALSVYKPRGITRHGWRVQAAGRIGGPPSHA
jgi:hypothetical protein